VKKYVYDTIRYDYPNKGDEFLAWINEKLKSYPVPLKDLTIEFDYEDCYGSVSGQLGVSYEREETQEEKLLREADEEKRRNWKRKQYEDLKKEFEGK